MTKEQMIEQLEKAVNAIQHAPLPSPGTVAEWHAFLEALRTACLAVNLVKECLKTTDIAKGADGQGEG